MTDAASSSASSPPPPIDPKSLDPSRILNLNVGVLGHVDSGKTSLVKTLSTLLSTAALDKSAQSRQRGITLDLGFSAFLMHPLPETVASAELPEGERAEVEAEAEAEANDGDGGDGSSGGGTKKKGSASPLTYADRYDALQITLVDCPGHASLIRTIIGGAQIIDMVLLVVDALKGVQTQTAECIVIAELCCRDLIVALNKVDLFPEEERERRLKESERKVRGALRGTRFGGEVPVVGVSACVGGEKVAAEGGREPLASTSSSASNANESDGTGAVQTSNISGLLEVLKSNLRAPDRSHSSDSAFHFAVDHCFPIRGQGTVLTGTCLSGSLQINDPVEFPTLGKITRKVKSMQMFRRKVTSIRQGDRAGICVSNFDPKLMERGVASSPGSVKLVHGAVAVVRKVRYYRGELRSGGKFHVSVGHSTVMATVEFFGAREIRERLRWGGEEALAPKLEEETADATSVGSAKKKGKGGAKGSSDQQKKAGATMLGGDADLAGLPRLKFDFTDDFLHQDGYLESLPDTGGADEAPSKKGSGGPGSNNADSLLPLHFATLSFQSPVHCPLDSLVIGSRLDADVAHNTAAASACRLAFSGRLVSEFSPSADAVRTYTEKERTGSVCRLGDAYRRDDDGRVVRYEVYGTDLFKRETNMSQFVGMRVVTDRSDVGLIQSGFGTSGKFRCHFPAGTEVREGDALRLKFRRYADDAQKLMRQDYMGDMPEGRVGTRMAERERKKKKKKKGGAAAGAAMGAAGAGAGAGGAAATPSPTKGQAPATTKTTTEEKDPNGVGEISALKGDPLPSSSSSAPAHNLIIVSGFFTPEVNVKSYAGRRVLIPTTNEVGTLVGPFGKAGKCKVSFEEAVVEDTEEENNVTSGRGCSGKVGDRAELLPP